MKLNNLNIETDISQNIKIKSNPAQIVYKQNSDSKC